MKENGITFEKLPVVVAQLRDEVKAMRDMFADLMKTIGRHAENRHLPMSVKEAAAYLKIPLSTLYMKLSDGSIPAIKPGKRCILFRDELDKWLEVNRKNSVPLTAEEENMAILASHRRKPGNLIHKVKTI